MHSSCGSGEVGEASLFLPDSDIIFLTFLSVWEKTAQPRECSAVTVFNLTSVYEADIIRRW